MTEKPEKKESLLLNLVLNIVIPTVILTKFSGEDALGVRNGIIVALSFPIIYGLLDLRRAKKVNIFSVIAIVSILLTGGISLLELDPKYIAIKEAAIPSILGIITIGSLFTPYPILKVVLFNDKLVRVERVNQALAQHDNEAAFTKSFRVASYIFASSFGLSAILNYALARYIVVSPPGTEEFNAELGRMTALSFPVIAVPSMLLSIAALFYLYRKITQLTHLTLEDIVVDPNEPHTSDRQTPEE